MSRTPGWRACFLCLHGRSQCQGIVMHTAVMNRDGIPNENMQKLHSPVSTLEQNPSANWVMHGKWGDIAWMMVVRGIVLMVLHGTTVQSIVCHGIVRTTVVHGPEFHWYYSSDPEWLV